MASKSDDDSQYYILLQVGSPLPKHHWLVPTVNRQNPTWMTAGSACWVPQEPLTEPALESSKQGGWEGVAQFPPWTQGEIRATSFKH